MKTQFAFATLALAAAASVSSAAILEQTTLLNANSVGAFGTAGNTVVTYTTTNAVPTFSRLLIGDFVQRVAAASTPNQSRVAIGFNGGSNVGYTPNGTTSAYSTGGFYQNYFGIAYTNPSGVTTLPAGSTVRVETYESVDDAGTDARHLELSVFFGDTNLPANIVDLGTLTNSGAGPGTVTATVSFAPKQVTFYKFTTTEAASGPDFLNIATGGAGSTLPDSDTQIALFNSTGGAVGLNDDTGATFNSTLRYGSGASGNLLGTATLPAGTYYLGVAAYSDTNVFSSGFNLGSASTLSGSIPLTITVPEPTTLAALGGLAVTALRRRR